MPGVAVLLQLSEKLSLWFGHPRGFLSALKLSNLGGLDEVGKRFEGEEDARCEERGGELPVERDGDVRDKLDGTLGIKVGAEGICGSSCSCWSRFSSSCSSVQPGGPGIGLRPSRKALAMSAAFHFEYRILS